MQMLNSYSIFQSNNKNIELYNGDPILGVACVFYYDDCGTQTDFDFPDFISANLVVYNERLGTVLKTIPLTRDGSSLIVNSTDTDFDENGNYFYEINYLASGGYNRNLAFGMFTVL